MNVLGVVCFVALVAGAVYVWRVRHACNDLFEPWAYEDLEDWDDGGWSADGDVVEGSEASR